MKFWKTFRLHYSQEVSLLENYKWNFQEIVEKCNLKAMLDVFCGWRLQTLIQLSGWTVGGAMIQGCQRICFLIRSCFLFVLLLCKLLQKDLGELVSMMERNPDCSMKTFHELCESWFCEGIGKKIYEEQRDEDWKSIYDIGWREQGVGGILVKKGS